MHTLEFFSDLCIRRRYRFSNNSVALINSVCVYIFTPKAKLKCCNCIYFVLFTCLYLNKFENFTIIL